MRHSAEESKYSHDEHCFETTVFPHHCGTTAAKVQSPKHTASLAASLAAGQPGQGTKNRDVLKGHVRETKGWICESLCRGSAHVGEGWGAMGEVRACADGSAHAVEGGMG